MILFVAKLTRRFKPDVIHTNTMVVLGGAFGAKLALAAHLWHIPEIPISPSWLQGAAARISQPASLTTLFGTPTQRDMPSSETTRTCTAKLLSFTMASMAIVCGLYLTKAQPANCWAGRVTRRLP